MKSLAISKAALRPIYDIGRLFKAMCYIGVVMLACKSGLLRWLQASLVEH
jgi:hypothetical protein